MTGQFLVSLSSPISLPGNYYDFKLLYAFKKIILRGGLNVNIVLKKKVGMNYPVHRYPKGKSIIFSALSSNLLINYINLILQVIIKCIEF